MNADFPINPAEAYPAQRDQRLRLVRAAHTGVDASVATLLKRLEPVACRAGHSVGDVRAAYAKGRRPLIGPMPDVRAVARIDPPSLSPLTIFYPQGTGDGTLVPGLLFFHGGGWTLGGLDTYEPFCRALSNAMRSAVIWVEYRLAPEAPFPAAVEDSWAAAEWLAENAAYLGIDPDNLAVGGDSAGGNLAAVASLAARDGLIAFNAAYQLLLYPCLDLTAQLPSHRRFANGYLLTADVYRWYRSNYLPVAVDPTDWRVSPFFAESYAGLPPTVILSAGHDPLVDEAIIYAIKLRLAGVRTVSIEFPAMIHGFLTMRGAIPAAQVALERIAAVIECLGRG